MSRRWFKPIAFAVVALSLTAASCDSLSNPVSPDVQSSAQSQTISQVAIAPSAITVNYHFVSATPDNNTILDLRSLIGILGGVLQVNKHTLTVPAGAVLVPTLFSMSVKRKS